MANRSRTSSMRTGKNGCSEWSWSCCFRLVFTLAARDWQGSEPLETISLRPTRSSLRSRSNSGRNRNSLAWDSEAEPVLARRSRRIETDPTSERNVDETVGESGSCNGTSDTPEDVTGRFEAAKSDPESAIAPEQTRCGSPVVGRMFDWASTRRRREQGRVVLNGNGEHRYD